MQNANRNNTVIYILALVAATVIALAAIMYYSNARKPDTIGERVDNAVESLQDRSPAEKVGDAVEDAGDKVQDNLK